MARGAGARAAEAAGRRGQAVTVHTKACRIVWKDTVRLPNSTGSWRRCPCSSRSAAAPAAAAAADSLPEDAIRIESLTPEQAKKLAAEFPGVRVVIEGNIGTSFIERSLPLNGLKSLDAATPKTLTALIEKEDVEIPLIETLELIQEPDGSPTDDFVIPKGFESRQKARQQGR